MPKQPPIVRDEEIHDHLKHAVQRSPLSVTWLAKQLGRDRTTIYKWLDGTNAIPPGLLEQLCRLLNLSKTESIAQFVGRGYNVPHTFLEPVHHLRTPTSDFVGRAREIAQIVGSFKASVNSDTRS